MQERVEDTRARGHTEPVTTAAELGRGRVSGDPKGPALLPSLAQHTLPTQPRSQPCSQPRQTPSPTWKSSGCRRCPCACVPAMARLGSAQPPRH